jgi:voltage-gated sodium channel
MKTISEIALKITSSRIFINFIFFLILLSAVVIGLETYPAMVREYYDILIFTDRLIIAFFTLEIVLKILSNGKAPWRYFKDPWNVFDFVIVAICLIPVSDTHYFSVFRILRVLRILRLITVFPKLRMIIGALLKSIPSMGYVVMLIGLLFYVYAVTGVFIFGKADPLHFGDLHHAMVTLFKVLTLEGWTDIMNIHVLGPVNQEQQQIVSFWPFLYFASFILIGAMIIMNLFIGVIMNSMEESQAELSKEINEMKYQDKNTEELYRDIIAKLDDLNREVKSLRKPGA